MKNLATILALFVTFVVLATSTPASATTVTSNLDVSVTVDSGCSIATTPVAFSMYAPIGANATTSDDAEGSVTIICTTGTQASIGLNLGTNSTGVQARLLGGGNYVNYGLYQDAAHNFVWGNSSPNWFTAPSAPNTSPRTYSVYGRIPAGQSAPSGEYHDTVVATVNF